MTGDAREKNQQETVEAYSPETDTHYPSWEALVSAEANGYVVVMLLSDDKRTWPYLRGPYATKAEATQARDTLRKRLLREEAERHPDSRRRISGYVRPLWEPIKGRIKK